MSMPIGASVGDYARMHKGRPAQKPMKPQAPPSNGSSIFRKKSRFIPGRAPSSTNSSKDSTLSPPERPATSAAHSRGGSGGSSIASLNDVHPSSMRRRSASLRKQAQASISSDMLARTTSRDTSMSIRPSTATTHDSQATTVAPFIQRMHSAGLLHRLQNLATKRISTLDYLKKTHQGHTFWLNTQLFTHEDLGKLPYFDHTKLPRRATIYFMLGNSIPAVLDPNANNLMEYLKAFNALLSEFEAYSNQHSPDSTSSGAMSRVRRARMFTRPSGTGVGKARRESGVSLATTVEDGPASNATPAPLPGSDRELLAGENYKYLLTPLLPFEPDYNETFATLCDVLIDCYSTLLGLVQSLDISAHTVEDLFTKADAKVKKLLINNLIRDFETGSKQGLRGEIAGVGKIVLSPLAG